MLNGRQMGMFTTIPNDIVSLTDMSVKGTRVTPTDDGTEQETNTGSKKAKIEDFGEKIGGARKDYFAVWCDELTNATFTELVKNPLTKSWPVPKYDKLLEAGIEPWRVAALRAIRETVPNKPRGKYNYKKEEWVANFVWPLRDMAIEIMNGSISRENFWKSCNTDVAQPRQRFCGREQRRNRRKICC